MYSICSQLFGMALMAIVGYYTLKHVKELTARCKSEDPAVRTAAGIQMIYEQIASWGCIIVMALGFLALVLLNSRN